MKSGTYSLTQLFTYTGVSRWRIATHLALLMLYRLLGRRYVTARVNEYRMKLDLHTPGLSKVLFVYGTRELPDIAVAHEVITPGMVVADIGANIGYYSLLEAHLAGPTGHVHAFEPDPRNLPLLRDNVALNQQTDRITVYEQAVSDRREQKDFQLGARSNVSSFVDRPDVVDTVPVDCIALHEFEHIAAVDMLRMDAEGYEVKIIAGVLPYLKTTDKPFTIMLEVHPNEYNDTDLNFAAQLDALFELGFEASHVILGAKQRERMQSHDLHPASTWTETRYTRDIYTAVPQAVVQELLAAGVIRSMVLRRP
jgi:FkbM family methyltransferase